MSQTIRDEINSILNENLKYKKMSKSYGKILGSYQATDKICKLVAARLENVGDTSSFKLYELIQELRGEKNG